MQLLPVSTIIPTLDRRDRLIRTLSGLFKQSAVPMEVLLVDASAEPVTLTALPTIPNGVIVRCLPAAVRGAASQRNQAQAAATQPYLLYLDDDVDLETGSIKALWETMQNDPQCGGCGVGLTNQHYHPPGRGMRRIYRWLGCPAEGSLAGRCTGPALNFLPSLDGTPAGGTVEWLNLCCTLYRRAALPVPALLPFFHGYSLMEDAALAIHVARRWKLSVPPAARAYHDSRPADYKSRVFAREKMETVNRWFVMRQVMGRDSLAWDLRQFAFQVLMLIAPLGRAEGWARLPAALAGKAAGLATVLLQGRRWHGYHPDPPS